MESDVKEFIASCSTCQKTRLGQGQAAAALKSTTVQEPFQIIAVDTIGPLPEDEAGNKYIVCIIDCFSRFVEAIPCKDASAKSAAGALLQVFGRYGAPSEVRSDQGSQFAAAVTQELLEYCGTHSRFTLPYRPQANGMVERANGEVMRHLKAIMYDTKDHHRWSVYLPLAQRIVNSTVHSAIGTMPMRVMFGDAITSDRELIVRPKGAEVKTYDLYINDLQESYEAIVASSQAHQQRVVQSYLAKSPELPTTFRIGDAVLVSYPGRAPTKLHPKWRGPMTILSASGNTYTVLDVRTGKEIDFDVSRLKMFKPADDEKAIEVAAHDDFEFVVELIVNHRGDARHRRSLEFKVRWQGYEPVEDTWEPYDAVKDLAAKEHPELRL